MEEEFRVIEDHPVYSVSNYGRVRNNHTGRILKATRNPTNGWYTVDLRSARRTTTRALPRLVAETFLPESEDPNTSILHRDGDRANCAADNLVWKPRWFVVCFMKEMQYPHVHDRRLIYSDYKGLVFESVGQMASAVLMLPSVLFDLLYGSDVAYFPGYGAMGTPEKLTYARAIHGL